jgi:hypothetical protein
MEWTQIKVLQVRNRASSLGIVELSWFELSSRLVRDCNMPTSDGMDPVSLFSDKSRSRNLAKDHSVVGIVA